MESKLHLPAEKIALARELAARIAEPMQRYIRRHTTVAVERATLRLMGADGANAIGTPVPNLIVDALPDRLSGGVTRYYVNALLRKHWTPEQLNQAVIDGFDLGGLELTDAAAIEAKAAGLVEQFERHVRGVVADRNARLDACRDNARSPLLYVIVATGNIHEDVKQAQAAGEQGADVIAVIRTTAQSLLDYVPFGATTEGFGGTYATQENFRIMRAALDETSNKVQRYIRLVNYASGLCMPEIAAMGAMERLDMMLNDSMYGILFRDINVYRTFVDQHFSRMIHAFAEIVINTGEDNYLTTSDAVEKAYTVLASQFLNERFAWNAGMPNRLIGLGHAFEMDPDLTDGFLLELAQAQMAREIFPECPLKYMPPTKHMTGDIFRGYIMNAMFNLASKLSGQSIHLLGILTEAIHTPYLHDRYLAIRNAQYVMRQIESLAEELQFRPDGRIVHRAHAVLDEAVRFLTQIEAMGLPAAIADGLFADVKRAPDGGKGLEGVIEKGADYWNPFEQFLCDRL
ncbi:MAG: lysine 5,6-aminomutase subunit alpha, partial [Phycisphaerae bacterium]|nr:lysine 5,6-aminomutase subunit alpha [Phycisphaerae bacterium]